MVPRVETDSETLIPHHMGEHPCNGDASLEQLHPGPHSLQLTSPAPIPSLLTNLLTIIRLPGQICLQGKRHDQQTGLFSLFDNINRLFIIKLVSAL